MNLSGIDITEVVERTKAQLQSDEDASPALKASIELILMVVVLLAQRLGLNSNNSSIPPSKDSHRKKAPSKPSDKKVGGQVGHKGVTLAPVDEPDEVKVLYVTQASLPKGYYRKAGFMLRQVVDIDITRVVTEYQAQILVDEQGKRFVADFPDGVNSSVQYGNGVKAHAVYLSQYQLLPYKRIEEYFTDQLGIPLSSGTLVRFNQQAAELLEQTGATDKIETALKGSPLLHVDETGINIGGKRQWLHCASSPWWTSFHPHAKRGKEAMDDAGILPDYAGILCHDHWKPYYRYTQAKHALCNAHHLRELARAFEQDEQWWAKTMQDFLLSLNAEVAGQPMGVLTPDKVQHYRQRYREILREGEQTCPAPDKESREPGQRGRLKRSKSRALLERLREYEDDTLRFIQNSHVPFTNNQGENDIRMTKVQQKISGCFRSMKGAQTFCTVRGYLSSCRKQDVSASEALTLLFKNQLPHIFQNEAAE
jgi:transposase